MIRTHPPPRNGSSSLYFFSSFGFSFLVTYLFSTLQDDGYWLFPHVFYTFNCVLPRLDMVLTCICFGLSPFIRLRTRHTPTRPRDWPTSNNGNQIRYALAIAVFPAPGSPRFFVCPPSPTYPLSTFGSLVTFYARINYLGSGDTNPLAIFLFLGGVEPRAVFS